MVLHIELPGAQVRWSDHVAPCGNATGGPRRPFGRWRFDAELGTMTLGAGPPCKRCLATLRQRLGRLTHLLQEITHA